ncbi:MAG: Fe-S cluster assembly protein IscX [Pleurocapsa minor GSE-CHR-MK-17-07R]|jgi:FeS assembly protein IscX|nr:Fe-S cluster assembly protein IscX [Pleurocapsa minor GSE-CHR-MK 17-07R]
MNTEQPLLYWDASYEIALALIETYPDVDVEDVGLEQLKTWVFSLPNFADNPDLVNDAILTDILREWYEEVSAR